MLLSVEALHGGGCRIGELKQRLRSLDGFADEVLEMALFILLLNGCVCP
jgi:hypothetical protein